MKVVLKSVVLVVILSLIGCGAAVVPDEKFAYHVLDEEGISDLNIGVFKPAVDPSQTPTMVSPRPAVVFIHGGGWEAGRAQDMYSFASLARDKGFVTFAVDYRLTGVAPWPAQANDVRCAVGWVVNHAGMYNIDINAITLVGESSGGHLALMVGEEGGYLADDCLYRESAAVKLVVSRAGPADVQLWYDLGGFAVNWVDKLLGGVNTISDVSPVDNLSPGSTLNVLQQHGGKDIIVEGSVAVSYSDALYALGRKHTYQYYPTLGHTLLEGDVSPRNDAIDWIKNNL